MGQAGRRGAAQRDEGSSGGRSVLGRLVYFGLVLGLWGLIGAAGLVAFHASQLPPIDQLAVPKRPPNIAILASDGTPSRQSRRDRRARRRPERAAALPAEGVHRHRGPALLRSFRHRSGRHRPRRHAQPQPRRRHPGRLDADPAARQEPLPDAGAHRLAQDPGSHPGPVARAHLFQGPDPRALPQPRLFRRRRLRRRGGGAALLRQVGPRGQPIRGGRAGRPRPGAVAPGAEPQSRTRRRRAPSSCSRPWASRASCGPTR